MVLYRRSWEGVGGGGEDVDCCCCDAEVQRGFIDRGDEATRWCRLIWVREGGVDVQEREAWRECQLVLHNVRDLKHLKTFSVG